MTEKLTYREQLKKLADEAFDAEDYKTLKQLRLKILEYDKDHAPPKPKNCPLEHILGIDEKMREN